MKNIVLAVSAAVLLASCSSDAGKDSFGEGDIVLVVEHGSEWHHSFPFLKVFDIENEPQIAAWAEDSAGRYVKTLYISHRAAESDWRMANGARRPEALPVWSHRRGKRYSDGLMMPDGTDSLPDAVTGATPVGDFDVSFSDLGQGYTVFVELNHSADYNEYYTEDNSGLNGQPSVVLKATVGDSQTDTIAFEIAGHGSVDGSEGMISPFTDSLTTALKIIERAYIVKKHSNR